MAVPDNIVNQITGAFYPQITAMRQQGMSTEDLMKAIGQPNDMVYAMGGQMQPPMQQPLVNPAGLNGGGSGGGSSAPTAPGGTSQTTPGFQGFPNFQVPFPYPNLPAQLQASMQTPRNQTYGRFGNMPATAQGTPGSLPQLPPQAQGLPQMPPSPAGLPQLPTQQPGTMNASNLPPGPGGGMPGFTPNQGGSYAQM